MSDEDIKIPEDVKEEPVVVQLEEPETPKVEEKASEVDDREAAVEALRRQVEEQKTAVEHERRARAEMEAFARAQAEKAQSTQAEIQTSHYRIITNAISATEQTALAAERDYADAMAAGDYSAAAKAQRVMAQAESRLLELNRGKSALEERLEARGTVREELPEIRPTPVPKDPLEEMASRLTPKSAEWLRAHPDAVGKVSKLTAAHSAAVELEGLTPETPEYFAYIEQRLGYTQEKSQQESVKSPPKQRIPSAPVSSGGNTRSSGGNSMTLSPQEVEMALLQEPTLSREEALATYAKNKAALVKEGRLR